MMLMKIFKMNKLCFMIFNDNHNMDKLHNTKEVKKTEEDNG